LIKFE